MPASEEECRKIREAFVNSLKVFDESAVRILQFHLEEQYGIRIGEAPCSSVEEIEEALLDISGFAADLLVSRMRSYLR